MYAIIETGGKQYRVTPGEVVSFERLDGSVGQTLTFDKVLLVGGGADSKVLVGKPYVAAATLSAEIVEQSKGDKIVTIKYRRRKGYRRTMGHRQMLTRVLITKLESSAGNAALETSKRAEVLRKASVPFSTRQSKREAARASGSAKAATTKTAAPKKAAATKTTSSKKKA